MNKFIFVSYQQGLGGENLSVRISQTEMCETLTCRKTPEGRTIIQNDFFGKFFIDCPIIIDGKIFHGEKNINKVKNFFFQKKKINAQHKTLVVPCHFNMESMIDEFPHEKFVIIDAPRTQKEQQKILDDTYKKVWSCVLKTPAEILGETMCIMQKINPVPDVKDVLRNMKRKEITVGELWCYLKRTEPTEENQKQLFLQLKPHENLQKNTNIKPGKNIIRIPYIDALSITGDDVIKKLFGREK